MSTNEEILTTEQIESIVSAAKSPLLLNHSTLYAGGRWTGIMLVTKPSGLILINGNDHTGYEHIRIRHGYGSRRHWHEATLPNGDRTLKLDDASRFRPGTVPIVDYPAMAEALYSGGCRDDARNKRPELFDKYIGDYIHEDGITEKLTLLLYKNTKIIHTLFPLKSTNNKPRLKDFQFLRGGFSAKWLISSGIINIELPYFNYEDKIKYTIFYNLNFATSVREVGIWAHNKLGVPYQYLLIESAPFEGNAKEVYDDLPFRMQYADLRWIEKFIKDTERGEIPFEGN